MTAVRRRLPSNRRLAQHHLKIGGYSIHIGIGFYPEGAPGEVWLDASKDGSDLRHFANGFAIAVSLLLQYGVPVDVIAHAFGKFSGGQSGAVEGHDTIKTASSIIDLVAQLLRIHGGNNA